MFKKIYVTNTTTYTYPIKRMDIVLLHTRTIQRAYIPTFLMTSLLKQ